MQNEVGDVLSPFAHARRVVPGLRLRERRE
jgi:hypothetical protein